LKQPKIPKKIKSALITIGSAAALAGINYTVIHSPFVLIMTFVLLVHEIGHYLVGKYYKADVKYPIFIPLPFLGIGITKVKNLKDEHNPSVALAGILFSLSYLFLLIITNQIVMMFSTLPLIAIAFSEFFFNYFGLDGIKYKLAVSKLNQ
jgi:hypothetical protein